MYAYYCRVVGAGQLACPVMPAQAWCGAPLLPHTQTPLLSLNNYSSDVVCPGPFRQAPLSCGSCSAPLLYIAICLEWQSLPCSVRHQPSVCFPALLSRLLRAFAYYT